MSMSEPEFKVGQEVQVSYRARVAEGGGPHLGREGRIIRLETTAIPTGWVDPAQEGLHIEVIAQPLPTEPGMYWANDNSQSQMNMGNFHTDGRQFFYRNVASEWADVGWGHPDVGMILNRLVDLPF